MLRKIPKAVVKKLGFLDFTCYEYLLKNNEIDRNKLTKMFSHETDTIAKLSKNIIRFVITERSIPEEMYGDLLNF